MAFLVRLTRRTAWPEGGKGALQDALATFERRPADVDGVSVYEVNSEEERLLIVAAIACQREDASRPVDWIEIPRSTVEKFGSVAVTLGDTPLEQANALHRSLDWDQEALYDLARELHGSGLPAKRCSPSNVRAAVASIDPDDVFGAAPRSLVEAERAKRGKAK